MRSTSARWILRRRGVRSVAYYEERLLFGQKVRIGFPASEQIINGNGDYFTCNVWPGRLSDCRVNDVLVNELRYRMAKRNWQRPRPVGMTVHRLRSRLRSYVRKISDYT